MTSPRFSFLASRFLPVLLCLFAVSAFAQPPDQGQADAEGFQPVHPEHIYSPEEIAHEIGNPTTLTLHLHEVAPRQVFDAIAAQASVEFFTFQNSEGKVSVDCDKEPFWMGLRTVLRQAGFELTKNYGNAKYWLRPAHDGGLSAFPPGPQVEAGPFIVQLSKIQPFGAFQLPPVSEGYAAAGRNVSLLRVEGQVMCDPKLEMFTIEPIVATATDDTGKELKSDRPLTEPMGADGVPQASRFSVELKAAGAGAQRLKTFAGSMHVQVIAQNETWEIPDPLKVGTAAKSFGPPDSRIGLILTAKRKEADHTIDVAITVVSKSQTPWLLTQLLHKNMRWSDANGNSIDGLITAVTAGGPVNSFTVRLNYWLAHGQAPLAEPVTLAIDVPTDIRTVVIPFEFHDLPLR